MRSPSSIFNSRFLRNELALGLLVIVVLELFLQGWAAARFFNHEVDKILQSVRSQRYDSPVVLIGDSVGRQVFGKWAAQQERFAMLATNQAVGWAGQYFIVKRYLARNPKPHAVVYMGRPSFGHGLDSVLRENYVERCFTNVAELGSLFMAVRDPAMTVRGALYRLLPSYRYRLHFRGLFLGQYGRVPPNAIGRLGEGGVHHKLGLFRVLGDALDRLFPREPASDLYFRKFLELCSDRGIDFIYVPAPLSTEERSLRRLYADRSRPLLSRLQAMNPRFFFCDDLYREYPPDDFRDGTHLKPEPLRTFQRQVMHSRLVSILKRRYAKRQGLPEWR